MRGRLIKNIAEWLSGSQKSCTFVHAFLTFKTEDYEEVESNRAWTERSLGAEL